MKSLVDLIETTHHLDDDQLRVLLTTTDAVVVDYLHERAGAVAQAHYGTGVFIR